MSAGRDSTGPDRVGLALKEAQALDLRKAGATFAQIAEQLGYNDRAAAHKAVVRALENTVNPRAEELRALESERLDRLMLAHWAGAAAGDKEATDTVLKIIQIRCKLLGLNAPTQVQVQGQVVTYRIEGVADLEAKLT